MSRDSSPEMEEVNGYNHEYHHKAQAHDTRTSAIPNPSYKLSRDEGGRLDRYLDASGPFDLAVKHIQTSVISLRQLLQSPVLHTLCFGFAVWVQSPLTVLMALLGTSADGIDLTLLTTVHHGSRALCQELFAMGTFNTTTSFHTNLFGRQYRFSLRPASMWLHDLSENPDQGAFVYFALLALTFYLMRDKPGILSPIPRRAIPSSSATASQNQITEENSWAKKLTLVCIHAALVDTPFVIALVMNFAVICLRSLFTGLYQEWAQHSRVLQKFVDKYTCFRWKKLVEGFTWIFVLVCLWMASVLLGFAYEGLARHIRESLQTQTFPVRFFPLHFD